MHDTTCHNGPHAIKPDDIWNNLSLLRSNSDSDIFIHMKWNFLLIISSRSQWSRVTLNAQPIVLRSFFLLLSFIKSLLWLVIPSSMGSIWGVQELENEIIQLENSIMPRHYWRLGAANGGLPLAQYFVAHLIKSYQCYHTKKKLYFIHNRQRPLKLTH